MKKSNIKILHNHNHKDSIAEIVDSNGGFKFMDHVSKEEQLIILNWLESQGVKFLVK